MKFDFSAIGQQRGRGYADNPDLQASRHQCSQTPTNTARSVAVVGAGISGLACARALAESGFSVTVFEKSRGPGGRMATRRTVSDLQIDHGAQYFTARDRQFQQCVESWQHDGLVAPWKARIVSLRSGRVIEVKQGTERFVGVPKMNSVCRQLASGLAIHYNTKISPPLGVDGRWQLFASDDKDLGRFDVVVLSAPASQTADLLQSVPHLAARASAVEMSACWAVMVSVEEGLQLPFDAAFVHDSPLSWVARNNTKPGRSQHTEAWVLHASPEWSEANLELSGEVAERELVHEFWQAVGVVPKPIGFSQAHRWRYALPTSPLTERCMFDADLQIGACGDWCGGPRVEGAFLSGMAVAGEVLGLLPETITRVSV